MTRGVKLAIFFFSLSFVLLFFHASLSLFLNNVFSHKNSLNELENPEYVKSIKQQSGEYIPQLSEAIFGGKKIPVPPKNLTASISPKVLGQTTQEKWIEIDLSDQRLYAYEGDRVIYNFLVSTGKWAPTPKGEFRIWIKLRYTTMSGGNKNDNTYYYLPNVPYTMFFYKGYGLHGTYWHNNFGRPMSHGCVNLSIPDAEKLFWWAEPTLAEGQTTVYPTALNPGTKVVIHD